MGSIPVEVRIFLRKIFAIAYLQRSLLISILQHSVRYEFVSCAFIQTKYITRTTQLISLTLFSSCQNPPFLFKIILKLLVLVDGDQMLAKVYRKCCILFYWTVVHLIVIIQNHETGLSDVVSFSTAICFSDQ